MNDCFHALGQLAAGKFSMSFARGCQVHEEQELCPESCFEILAGHHLRRSRIFPRWEPSQESIGHQYSPNLGYNFQGKSWVSPGPRERRGHFVQFQRSRLFWRLSTRRSQRRTAPWRRPSKASAPTGKSIGITGQQGRRNRHACGSRRAGLGFRDLCRL
jgi:hypothetical protein